MKKSRPWNLNKESILKPSFNTFISPHKIIDISARVDNKNSLNNKYKSNIFKDCVNFICYSEFSLFGTDMWLYIFFSRAPVGVN